jgi:excisionase family DNA binding protein
VTLLQGRIFVTNSAATGRVLEASLNLWLQRYRDDGYPNGPLPEWIFTTVSELHTLGYGAQETAGNRLVSQKGQPATLTVMETAERLGMTRQGVTKNCRSGRLVADRVGKVWRIDSQSVTELERSRCF